RLGSLARVRAGPVRGTAFMSAASKTAGMPEHRVAGALAAALIMLGSTSAPGEPVSFALSTGRYGLRKEIPHALGIEMEVGQPWRRGLHRQDRGARRGLTGDSAEKEPVRGILALVDPWIPHRLQEAPELRHLRARDLHADQHAAVVGAVVAVVEEADVPIGAHP